MSGILTILGLVCVASGGWGAYVVSQSSLPGLYDSAAALVAMVQMTRGNVDFRIMFTAYAAQFRGHLLIAGVILLLLGLATRSPKSEK